VQKSDRRGPGDSIDVRTGVGGRSAPNEPEGGGGYDFGEEPF
jgi:hypothetical protein